MQYVIIEPGTRCIPVVPSDTQNIAQVTGGITGGGIPYARKIRCTANGDISLITLGGDARTYTMTAGQIIDWVAVGQVKQTGTTGTFEAIY